MGSGRKLQQAYSPRQDDRTRKASSDAPMSKVSAVIIAFDEEADMARALRPIPSCDEILGSCTEGERLQRARPINQLQMVFQRPFWHEEAERRFSFRDHNLVVTG